MRILHAVEYYYPSVGGVQGVVRQLSERLVKLGHTVTILTSSNVDRKDKYLNGVEIKEFQISGNIVDGIVGNTDEYVNFLLNNDYDIISFFAAQQWSSDLGLLNIENIKIKKVFIPTGFSSLYNDKFSGYYDKMKAWMKQFDMNVFLSDDYRDVNFARNNDVINRILIPNGAGKDEFLINNKSNIRERIGIGREDFLILNVGSHTGLKGHKEAIEIFKKAKIQKTTLLIIGNTIGTSNKEKTLARKIKDLIKKVLSIFIFRYKVDCPDLCSMIEEEYNSSKNSIKSKKKIFVKELNRHDTVEAYKEADLFLFPSNIECSPIVLFESMASKTPFLTSSAGNAKEIIEWSKGGLLLASKKSKKGLCRINIKQSIRDLEYLYNNKELRLEFGKNGFNAWKKHYNWENIVLLYENMYKEILR